MKTLFVTLLLSIALSINVHAQRYVDDNIHQHMTQKEIQRMDRVYKKYKANRRYFQTEREYLYRSRHLKSDKYDRYDHGYDYKRDRYKKSYRKHRQRGYTHSKRGWKLAYKYDRASFYDSKGFHYGYFNKHGFVFEGIFYRYDREYTYRDRVRGKGLFDHRYYMPENSRYYGFYAPQHR